EDIVRDRVLRRSALALSVATIVGDEQILSERREPRGRFGSRCADRVLPATVIEDGGLRSGLAEPDRVEMNAVRCDDVVLRDREDRRGAGYGFLTDSACD